jgi:hypothetical protein
MSGPHEAIPDAIAAALAILCGQFGKEKDLEVMRVYSRVLQKHHATSSVLLEAAVEHAIETRTFFPSVSEFLDDIRVVRQRVLAEQAHQPCPQCARTPGWIETTATGQRIVYEFGREAVMTTSEALRATRCPCYLAWQSGLEAIGVLPPVASAAPRGGWTRVGDLADREPRTLRVEGHAEVAR